MTDIFSETKRSQIMSRIRNRNTSPEKDVRRILHRNGFRFRLCAKQLPGKPDIVLKKYRAVIFVHGCFWHGHDGCSKSSIPHTRTEFWLQKIQENKNRDKRQIGKLIAADWRVCVIWQCALLRRFDDQITELLISFLKSEVTFLEIGRSSFENALTVNFQAPLIN